MSTLNFCLDLSRIMIVYTDYAPSSHPVSTKIETYAKFGRTQSEDT